MLIGSDVTEKRVLRIPCSEAEDKLYEYASAGERLTEVVEVDVVVNSAYQPDTIAPEVTSLIGNFRYCLRLCP